MNPAQSLAAAAAGKRSLFRSSSEILASYALIAGALVLARHAPASPWAIVAFFVISSRQNSLVLLMHEGFHGALCRSRKLNDFLAEYVLAFPVGALFRVGRERHSAHHNLFTTDADPDKRFYMAGSASGRNPLVQLWKTVVFLVLNYRILTGKVRTGLRGGQGAVAGMLLAYQLGIWALLWAWSGAWWFYLAFWLLPILNFAIFFDKFRLFCEHVPERDGRIVTRDFRSNPVERFFLAPFHANYHVEHHLFPWVPHRELPAIRAALLPHRDSPDFVHESSYAGFFWRAFLKKDLTRSADKSSRTA